MTFPRSRRNQVRHRRLAAGLTQLGLATKAEISRAAVAAIEGERLVPAVTAAIALARALGCSVEELFTEPAEDQTVTWARTPPEGFDFRVQAEINGKLVCFPALSAPSWAPLPDDLIGEVAVPREQTLVLASCDPAASLMASLFARKSGMRLLIERCSSRRAVEMVQAGHAHLAAMHLSTDDDPGANQGLVNSVLGAGHGLLHLAQWQEGIAVSPTKKARSLAGIRAARWRWVGREPGSGARKCQDRILDGKAIPRIAAGHHRAVAEAVHSGWADAGVCVRSVSAEMGLDFVPVQTERVEICFSRSLLPDPRWKAFLNVVQSPEYRKLLRGLPGYDTTETGEISTSL